VSNTVVVYVHGLWLTGIEGSVLRKRLSRVLSARTATFSYPSVRRDITANAAALLDFLVELRADKLHLIGHSLGGLVILKAFESAVAVGLPPGRIVLLGSPLLGSRTAQRVAARPFGRAILGKAVQEELLSARERYWHGPRELGVIAGDLAIGLGRLLARHDTASDGTVFLDETRLGGVNDHLTLRVSHSGLPFSSDVAKQASAFLANGRFIR
jgi:pimeloyl-ACP methyl ester carboxylesterase